MAFGTAQYLHIGTTAAEWRNLYLTDGGIIYGQANQSATLTSSASKWTANNFDITTAFGIPATITGAAASTWTVVDNNASGLSIGSTGKADILKVISTDAGEGVTMSGTLGVTGALTCSSTVGVATSLNPDASDGATLGTTALEWSDLYLADGNPAIDDNVARLNVVVDPS